MDFVARETLASLESADIDLIALAGYLRLIPPAVVRRFRNRILNIHPSLLPAFPGVDAQRQALEYGARVSGVTVHLVNAELDAGPIVLQRTVAVLDGDTVESVSERILVEEHRAYPDAVSQILDGGWRIEGRRFVRE